MFALGSASALGLLVTLILAWQHELGVLSLPGVLVIRPMVSVHGLINGLVVAPCFLLAVALEAQPTATTALPSLSQASDRMSSSAQ